MLSSIPNTLVNKAKRSKRKRKNRDNSEILETDRQMIEDSYEESYESSNESDEEAIPESEEEKLAKRKWFYRQNELKKVKWDLFIMLLATWNCFTIPINSAFEPKGMQTFWFEAINSFIDIIFMIDVIINFRVTYMNQKTGEEEFDLK